MPIGSALKRNGKGDFIGVEFDPSVHNELWEAVRKGPPLSWLTRVRIIIHWCAVVLFLGPIVVGLFRQVTGLDPTPKMEISPAWMKGWNIAGLIVFPTLVMFMLKDSRCVKSGIWFFGFNAVFHIILFTCFHL